MQREKEGDRENGLKGEEAAGAEEGGKVPEIGNGGKEGFADTEIEKNKERTDRTDARIG